MATPTLEAAEGMVAAGVAATLGVSAVMVTGAVAAVSGERLDCPQHRYLGI